MGTRGLKYLWKNYIIKCAVRAVLVRVIALNQLLGMPKLLCIILYFQIKTNENINEKSTCALLLFSLHAVFF